MTYTIIIINTITHILLLGVKGSRKDGKSPLTALTRKPNLILSKFPQPISKLEVYFLYI